MGELLGQLYVDKHYQEEARARMETMIANLVEAYRQSITELDWMGEETKQQALVKLSKFKPKIGYPGKWRDYSSMEIVEGDLLANIKSAAEFEYKRNVRQTRQAGRQERVVHEPANGQCLLQPGME